MPGHGYVATPVSSEECEAALETLLRRKDVSKEEGPCATIVEVDSEETLYLVTQPGHFAHPSILKRTLVTTPCGRGIEVSAQTCANMELAKKWLSQFKDQDQTMAEALKQ